MKEVVEQLEKMITTKTIVGAPIIIAGKTVITPVKNAGLWYLEPAVTNTSETF